MKPCANSCVPGPASNRWRSSARRCIASIAVACASFPKVGCFWLEMRHILRRHLLARAWWRPSEKWDPAVRIGELRMPKLILHSREDEIIPFAHGEAVYDQAAAPKEFQPLLGRHIEAMRDPSVQKRVQDFFASRCGIKVEREEAVSPDLPSATVPGAALPALQPPRALTF